MQMPGTTQEPYRIAAETWIVPQLEPSGPDTLASVNSMVITGSEPLIVDTGCAVNRDRWLDQTFSIVEPTDVRWIFLSHADRDHVGNLDAALDACPHATVITTAWAVRYLMADGLPALERMRWVDDGASFDAGDRRLHAVCPPLWDGAETRGVYDPTTGVYWAADAFGSLLTHPVASAGELDPAFWRESLLHESRSAAAWHALLDPVKFDAHVDRSAGLEPTVVASAHGPVLDGPFVDEAYRLIRQVARMDRVPPADAGVLDAMVAAIAALPASQVA